MAFASAVHTAVEAVAPIDRITIGRNDDKSTWRIGFRPEATDEQKAAALIVLRDFIYVPPVEAEAPTDERLAQIMAENAQIKTVLAQLLSSIEAANKKTEPAP